MRTILIAGIMLLPVSGVAQTPVMDAWAKRDTWVCRSPYGINLLGNIRMAHMEHIDLRRFGCLSITGGEHATTYGGNANVAETGYGVGYILPFDWTINTASLRPY